MVNRTREAIRQFKQPVLNRNVEQVSPIADGMILPNHSGISSHPEFKNALSAYSLTTHNHNSTYLKLNGSNASGNIDIGIWDLESVGDFKASNFLATALEATEILFKGTATTSHTANLIQINKTGVTSALVSMSATGTWTFQNSANNISAYRFANAAGTSLLLMDTSSFRVGIGTDSPDGILHLDNGTSDTDHIIEKDAGTQARLVFHNAGSESGEIKQDASEDIIIRNKDQDSDIIFYGNDGGSDTELARFDTSVKQFNLGTATGGSTLNIKNQTGSTWSSASSANSNVTMIDTTAGVGAGNYGAAICFPQLTGTSGQRTAIVSQQAPASSDADRMGMEFWVHTSGSSSAALERAFSLVPGNFGLNLQAVCDGDMIISEDLDHNGDNVGFYGTAPTGQASHFANATTSHSITDPADSPATADALRDDLVNNTIPSIETDLNSLGTTINSIIAVLEGVGLMASS